MGTNNTYAISGFYEWWRRYNMERFRPQIVEPFTINYKWVNADIINKYLRPIQ